MKKFYKIFYLLSIIVVIFEINIVNLQTLDKSNAFDNTTVQIEDEIIYSIYDENGMFLFEKQNVVLGDIYINKNFKKYEIIKLNFNSQTGVARFLNDVKKPIVMENKIAQISTNLGKIGMYCTHNDESYVPSDNTSSIYGKGGIHDVAKRFKIELENLGLIVYFDETLHIPHNSTAYNRSRVTATNLKNNYKLDGLFDIHRDGASRSYYVKTINNIEKCRIRLVLGKANVNKDVNEQFAIYLLSIAEQIYPWLFSDIYIGAGHYNQDLLNTAILFEMGSHLVEKNLVFETMKPLAEVVAVALYGSTINTNTGDVIINGDNTNTNEISITDALENIKQENNGVNIFLTALIFLSISSFIVYLGFAFVRYSAIKRKHMNTHKIKNINDKTNKK